MTDQTPTTTTPAQTRYINFTANEGYYNHSPYYAEPRHYRFMGFCYVCGRRTYAFDDGNNDPRGPLGARAASPLVAADYSKEGDDLPLCFQCANTDELYSKALAFALEMWEGNLKPLGAE